jgi:hypothetical protein
MAVPYHIELPGGMSKGAEPHLIHYGAKEEGGKKEKERWLLMKRGLLSWFYNKFSV